MSEGAATPRRSITELPSYWIYLFCTAGLVALVLAGPKFAARQSQIERKDQGRQRAAQNLSGREPFTQLSDEEHTQIGLRPLYYVLGGLLVIAWLHLIWRQYLQPRTKLPPMLKHDNHERHETDETRRKTEEHWSS
jgi:hypothetical protein